jgi:hypothetical protein
VNNPSANGVCRVLGLGLKEQGLRHPQRSVQFVLQ